MNGIFNLSTTYAAQYQENPEKFIRVIAKTGVPVKIMNEVYRILVKEKQIIPIEDLPKEEKILIIKQAEEAGTVKEKLVSVCKVIHLFKQII